MHHELGSSRCAGRGEQERQRVGIGSIRAFTVGSREGIEANRGPPQNGSRRVFACIHDDNLLERRKLVGIDIREHGRKIDLAKIQLKDQHPRARFREDVFQLGGAIARIHRDEGRSDSREAEEQREPLDPIHQPNRNVISRAHAVGR